MAELPLNQQRATVKGPERLKTAPPCAGLPLVELSANRESLSVSVPAVRAIAPPRRSAVLAMNRQFVKFAGVSIPKSMAPPLIALLLVKVQFRARNRPLPIAMAPPALLPDPPKG